MNRCDRLEDCAERRSCGGKTCRPGRVVFTACVHPEDVQALQAEVDKYDQWHEAVAASEARIAGLTTGRNRV